MRLVIARCSVDYAGRLTAHLPAGRPADHGQGRRLRRHPRRRRRLQAAQLDERAQHGDRVVDDEGRRCGPCATPRARRSRSRSHEVLVRHDHELGVDPGLQKDGVEAHLQELLAANCDAIAAGLRLVRREYPTDIGPVDLLCRDADGSAVAIEIKRRGRDRRRRAADPLPRVPRPRPDAAPGPRRVRRPADQAAGPGAGRPSARSPASRSTTTSCGASSRRAPPVLSTSGRLHS